MFFGEPLKRRFGNKGLEAQLPRPAQPPARERAEATEGEVVGINLTIFLGILTMSPRIPMIFLGIPMIFLGGSYTESSGTFCVLHLILGISKLDYGNFRDGLFLSFFRGGPDGGGQRGLRPLVLQASYDPELHFGKVWARSMGS